MAAITNQLESNLEKPNETENNLKKEGWLPIEKRLCSGDSIYYFIENQNESREVYQGSNLNLISKLPEIEEPFTCLPINKPSQIKEIE